MSDKENKKQEQNQKEAQQENHNQDKKTPDNSKISKEEILNLQINELKAQNQKLSDEVEKFKTQIALLNEEYKQQVIAKAKQAEELLNAKIDEIKARYSDELAQKKKYALEKDALKLIDVIDNFELALKHEPNDPALKNYLSGFKMILNMFHNLYRDLSIQQLQVKVGDEFNHETMEVIEQVENNNFKSNQVVQVLKPGYKLHDKIISFTKVIVAK